MRTYSSERSPQGESPFLSLDSADPTSSRRKRERRATTATATALVVGETSEDEEEKQSDQDDYEVDYEDDGDGVGRGSSDSRRRSPRVLTTVTLAALCYFVVGGGPESGEQIIVAAGPLLGLLSLAAFAVLYFYPMAYVVTELVSAIPEAGGHAYWIAAVFGPRMGLQAGYWSWVSNCVDCAIYASMSIRAIYRVAGLVGLPFLEFVAKATLALLLALPGFFDLRVVGSLAASLTVFVLVPYAVRHASLIWTWNCSSHS